MIAQSSADASISVVFVSSHEQVGGAEILMQRILARLPAESIRAVVVLAEGPLADDLRRQGYRVEVVPVGRRWRLLVGTLRLRRALRSIGAPVVHANGTRAAIAAAIATLGTSLRLVWLKVDCSGDGHLARLVARRCSTVVGISATATETLHGRLRHKVRVVYPGVEERHIDRVSARMAVLRRLDCRDQAQVLVASGRLCPPKGQLDVLEAMARLAPRFRSIHLALLGGEIRDYPGYGAALRSRADELGIANSVTFLGHRSPEIRSADDAIRFVAGCDLLVAASRTEPRSGWKEGFGLAPVEAMSVGTPVVAYRHGSLPEVLADCARFVAEGDREALAGEIGRVLTDERLRGRMIECGRQRVRDHYRWEDAASAIARAYLLAADGAGGA